MVAIFRRFILHFIAIAYSNSPPLCWSYWKLFRDGNGDLHHNVHRNKLIRSAGCISESSNRKSYGAYLMDAQIWSDRIDKWWFFQIEWGACYLTLAGNVFVYATLILFFVTVDSDDAEYNSWWKIWSSDYSLKSRLKDNKVLWWCIFTIHLRW